MGLTEKIVITPNLGNFVSYEYYQKIRDKYLEWIMAMTFSYYGKKVPEGTIMTQGGNWAEWVDNSFLTSYRIFRHEDIFNSSNIDELKKYFPIEEDPDTLNFYSKLFIEQREYDSKKNPNLSDIRAIMHLTVEHIFIPISGTEKVIAQPYVLLFNRNETNPDLVDQESVYIGSRENLHRVFKEVSGKELPSRIPQYLSDYVEQS